MSGPNGTNRGKTALVTGASGGIGYEFAKLLAQDGYNLILVARSKDTLLKQAADFKQKHSVEVRAIAKDLAQASSPQEVFDEVKSAGSNVNVLINNAGFATYGHFVELNLTKELEMMQVNIVTLTHLTRLFLPDMVERRSGKILNVASTAAFQPGPLMAVYYASKAFVLSFSEAIANELEGTGVSVTALCPGPTESGFQQRAAMEDSKLVNGKKIMSAETVAKAGYEAMLKGKTMIVPGLMNNLMAQSVRFTPRKMTTKIVRDMQESAH